MATVISHEQLPDVTVRPTASDLIRQNRWAYISVGVVLATLGLAAIAMPYVSTLAVEVFVGWLVFSGSLVRILALIGTPPRPGYLSSFLAAVFAGFVGLAMAMEPIAGRGALMAWLIALFVVEGTGALLIAFDAQRQHRRWGWMMLSGIVDLGLAYVLWSAWLAIAGWTVGILTGVNLVFLGVAVALL